MVKYIKVAWLCVLFLLPSLFAESSYATSLRFESKIIDKNSYYEFKATICDKSLKESIDICLGKIYAFANRMGYYNAGIIERPIITVKQNKCFDFYIKFILFTRRAK